MQADADRELIRGLSLFADLDAEDFERLFEVGEFKEYAEGEVLFAQGDSRDYMRVILGGRIDLATTDSYGQTKHLISYRRGDMIGEGVLLDGTVHTTGATAMRRARVFEMHRDRFAALFRDNPARKARVLTGFVRDIVGRMDQIRYQASPEALAFASGRTRPETDLLGEMEIPAEAYFGIQTARALANFDISGVSIRRYGNLLKALAMVKHAAARANQDCGALPKTIADAVAIACDEIMRGRLHDHFPLDVLQGGAGTSTNMNANEVIANRALEILGHEKGEYAFCHPNNHVNCSQSTNDVYPTALKLAMAMSVESLADTLRPLIEAFRARGADFADVIKMGRTQLQDAVPMTLGQEFDAYARSLEHELETLIDARDLLLEINMGGTAIGTGLNAPDGYAERVVEHLKVISSLPVRLADDLIESTQDTQGFVVFSSALKSLAIKLSKIANDLRLLSSGPRAGLGEINLPPRQPGSSIMPGKVNPVIPEVVNQVAYRVIGNDLTVTLAAEAGQLELNVMEPVIAAAILDSVEILASAAATFRVNCVDGITANPEVCRRYVEASIGLVTALVPVLGYERSSQLAKEAMKTGRGIVELVREKGWLDDRRIEELLAPRNMARQRGKG